MSGMNFDFSEEQLLLRGSARRFVDSEFSLEKRRELIASNAGFSSENWQHFAEMGWLGLILPEDVDGFNCSHIEMILLMEQMGRGLFVEPYVPTVVLGAQLIDRCGPEKMRKTILPTLIGGDLQLAFAHEERSIRGCPDMPTTSATQVSDGFVLSGNKTMVVNLPDADYIVVTAQIESSGDIGIFLLPRDIAGLSAPEYKLVCGRSAGDLVLNDVECGVEQLIAHAEVAKQTLAHVIDIAQVAYLAETLGGMESTLVLTSDYLKTREQFGQPIGRFQALQHLMADMFVDTQESRSILYSALSQLDSEAQMRKKAVSRARVVIGEASRRVVANGLQMHGGYGTTDESQISHHYRQIFTLERLFGDVNYHLQQLSDLG